MAKKKLIIFFSVLVSACVFLTAALIIFFNMPKKGPEAVIPQTNEAATDSSPAAPSPSSAEKNEASTNASGDATQPSSEVESPTQTDASDVSSGSEATGDKNEDSVPQELVDILSRDNKTVQDLNSRGCQQLVTVSSAGSSATINFFYQENGVWKKNDALTAYGFVGRNGVTENMQEGGNASPKGLYAVGDAFYQYDKPATGLGSFEIHSDTYWVDDPDSKYYNQKVEGTDDKDWDSAEQMGSIASYRYGFVIEYNTVRDGDITPGAGSAIFFHLSSGAPTAGCVSTDEASVLAYLSNLSASQNPYILIV